MMRDNLETYKIWAPDDALWTEWVKPVLFASVPFGVSVELIMPEVKWVAAAGRDTVIIIDLPDKTGVEEGLALAKMGYRPVPLYNGVSGPNRSLMNVDVRDIAAALFKGADILAGLKIQHGAPPVFLLDSNRMSGYGKTPGKFDNRWCVFPQDMPSAAFLSKKGIGKVIVRTDSVQNDLSHILCRYQEHGIKVYQCKDGKTIKDMTAIGRPSQFKSLVYRFKVILGLTRNAAGGFGGKIPEPQQSGSGGRYYGMG